MLAGSAFIRFICKGVAAGLLKEGSVGKLGRSLDFIAAASSFVSTLVRGGGCNEKPDDDGMFDY